MCGGLGEHVPSEQACALDFFSFFFLFPWVFMAAHGLSLMVAGAGGWGARGEPALLHCHLWTSHGSGFFC